MGKRFKQLVVGVTFMLLGFFVTFQVMHNQEDYSFVSLKTISDLQGEITNGLNEIKNLKELISAKNHKLMEYQNAIENEGSISDVLYTELQDLKTIAGLVDLEGPGITVKVGDSEREIYPFEDPRDFIIHEEDILVLINELRYAGAEAISVNGQRILPHTEIKCAGPTITINNHTSGQPFVIKAIGDPTTLEAAIKSPGSYAYDLKEYYDLVVESMVSQRVRIPKYQGDLIINYMSAQEGE